MNSFSSSHSTSSTIVRITCHHGILAKLQTTKKGSRAGERFYGCGCWLVISIKLVFFFFFFFCPHASIKANLRNFWLIFFEVNFASFHCIGIQPHIKVCNLFSLLVYICNNPMLSYLLFSFWV